MTLPASVAPQTRHIPGAARSACSNPPHLCHVFPGFGTGGPEVRAALLINALGDEFRHSILALDGNFDGRSRLSQPDAVRFVPGPPRRGRLRHPLALAGALRALAPDAVLTYGWGG